VLREGDKGRIETIPLLLIVNGMSAYGGTKSEGDQRRNISGMRCIKGEWRVVGKKKDPDFLLGPVIFLFCGVSKCRRVVAYFHM
jgi:hypothetical protein